MHGSAKPRRLPGEPCLQSTHLTPCNKAKSGFPMREHTPVGKREAMLVKLPSTYIYGFKAERGTENVYYCKGASGTQQCPSGRCNGPSMRDRRVTVWKTPSLDMERDNKGNTTGGDALKHTFHVRGGFLHHHILLKQHVATPCESCASRRASNHPRCEHTQPPVNAPGQSALYQYTAGRRTLHVPKEGIKKQNDSRAGSIGVCG